MILQYIIHRTEDLVHAASAEIIALCTMFQASAIILAFHALHGHVVRSGNQQKGECSERGGGCGIQCGVVLHIPVLARGSCQARVNGQADRGHRLVDIKRRTDAGDEFGCRR